MSTIHEPIRFGDVVKLQTSSGYVDTATRTYLGFFELLGKAQTQLLVVPPVKVEFQERFIDAEFIIAPVPGDKQPTNGTPLNYQTPFVLRTSDGKDGSTYSLNNKVPGQRDAVSLQLSGCKGEMYIQVEKDGCTSETGLQYGDEGLSLLVVDSNRVRKSFNHHLTHFVKPKSDTPGGIVTCSAKGAALAFSFHRALNGEGESLTETHKYIKNPQARRFSSEIPGLGNNSPTKVDELGRADRIDSSEFSDLDAMSRSSSLATLNSNPGSPRRASATPIDALALAACLPIDETVEDTEVEAASSSPSELHAATEANNVTIPAAAPASPQKTMMFFRTSVKTDVAKVEVSQASPVKLEHAKVETTKTEVETSEDVKKTPSEPAVNDSSQSAAPKSANDASTNEPKTVLADASTYPPMPSINGPAPAPVVISPKAAASSPNHIEMAAMSATPLSSPSNCKKEDEVAKLKAEAEVESLDPACGPKCKVM